MYVCVYVAIVVECACSPEPSLLALPSNSFSHKLERGRFFTGFAVGFWFVQLLFDLFDPSGSAVEFGSCRLPLIFQVDCHL